MSFQPIALRTRWIWYPFGMFLLIAVIPESLMAQTKKTTARHSLGTDGERGYQLGCLVMGALGQAGVINAPACGENPYNAQVNELIRKRDNQVNMNGGGVLKLTPQSGDILDLAP